MKVWPLQYDGGISGAGAGTATLQARVFPVAQPPPLPPVPLEDEVVEDEDDEEAEAIPPVPPMPLLLLEDVPGAPPMPPMPLVVLLLDDVVGAPPAPPVVLVEPPSPSMEEKQPAVVSAMRLNQEERSMPGGKARGRPS
jgi:hypothetical protein